MGNFRTEPETTQHNQTGKFGKLEFASSHMCGWRNYMEDASITCAPFEKKFGLFAVFDGHGGAQVSAFVERHFAQQLSNNQNFKKQRYEQALRQTFMKMDVLLRSERGKKEIEQIQKEMKEKGNGPKYDEPSRAGCTANVVFITPEKIYCANSGDSRAVASVKDQTCALSFDHKPQDEKQIQRIQKAGGTVNYGRVNGNLNLSRALGDLEYKSNEQLSAEQQMITANPDIKVIDNKNVDFIIMGCDGIWQVKTNEQMKEWVGARLKKKMVLTNIVNELLSELLAKDGGGEYGMDNMSAILINFQK